MRTYLRLNTKLSDFQTINLVCINFGHVIILFWSSYYTNNYQINKFIKFDAFDGTITFRQLGVSTGKRWIQKKLCGFEVATI